MHRIGEVYRRRPPGEHANIPFRREDIDLIRKQIDLHRIEELGWVLELSLPLHQLLEPRELLLVLQAHFRALFVLPVSGNPLFRHPVHFCSPDLDLNPSVVRTDYGGMQRPIEVRL